MSVNRYDDYKKLLKLIKNNSALVSCSELGLSKKELFECVQNLVNDGQILNPYFDSEGNIFYNDQKVNQDDPININTKKDEYSVAVISDTHVGSVYDDLTRFSMLKVFVDQNDINLVVNCGDIVDGTTHFNESVPKRVSIIDYQLGEFIDYYPYFNNANTVLVLGDHDLKYKLQYGKTISKELREKRHDIKVYSSGAGEVNINNKKILICHDSSDRRIQSRITDDVMLLSGHSHMYQNNTYFNGVDYSLRLKCPSLSNLPTLNYVLPGFLLLKMRYANSELINVEVIQYAFNNDEEIIFVGSTTYDMREKGIQRRRK